MLLISPFLLLAPTISQKYELRGGLPTICFVLPLKQCRRNLNTDTHHMVDSSCSVAMSILSQGRQRYGISCQGL